MIKILLNILFSALFITSAFAQTDNNWTTYFESSNYKQSPDYNNSIKYLKRLEKISEYAKLVPFGISPQGRTLYTFIISKDKIFNYNELKNSPKSKMLINCGIHSGEIEGKDAAILLARDLLIEKKYNDLLDNTILIIIPVFNVDGHERISKYNRINQNGPEEMGWRTTAQNLNLNRDFMKADAPEMKAFLKLWNDINPDFFVDLHTTDGLDMQYELTYSIEKISVSPMLRNWITKSFEPTFESLMLKDGYPLFKYFGFKGKELTDGVVEWNSSPRFSHGYSSMRGVPGVLIETHSLKPFKNRVYATYFALLNMMKIVSQNQTQLTEQKKESYNWFIDNFVIGDKRFPINHELLNKSYKTDFLGYETYLEKSEITGDSIIRYTKTPKTFSLDYYTEYKTTDSLKLPKYYIIPAQFGYLKEIIELHGITFTVNKTSKKVIGEFYKFSDVKLSPRSFEGRQLPSYKVNEFSKEFTINANDLIISTNQKNFIPLLYLLEPKSPDSFLKWGFLNSIFEQKEYFEDYSMEPIAKEMLEKDNKLKVEFERKLAEDEKFRNNPYQRLNFIYERSPYYDSNLNVYPIYKVDSELK
ncbi:MAG: M14 family metallopeptidase [Melioribacteraceae bacterium]|nr:M14 family metallopeptidase [Melioribacteraceae bacterium]